MYNPSFPMATDANGGGDSNAWAGGGGYGGQPIIAGAKRPNHPSGNSESSGSQFGPGGASAAEKKLKTYQVGSLMQRFGKVFQHELRPGWAKRGSSFLNQ